MNYKKEDFTDSDVLDARMKLVLASDIAYAYASALANRTGKYKHIEKHLLEVSDDLRKRLVDSKKVKLTKIVTKWLDNYDSMGIDIDSIPQCALFVIDWIYIMIAQIEILNKPEDTKHLQRLKYCISQLSRLIDKDPEVEVAFLYSDRIQEMLGVIV